MLDILVYNTVRSNSSFFFLLDNLKLCVWLALYFYWALKNMGLDHFVQTHSLVSSLHLGQEYIPVTWPDAVAPVTAYLHFDTFLC